MAASVAAVTVLGVQALFKEPDSPGTHIAQTTEAADVTTGSNPGPAEVASAEEATPWARPWMTDGDERVRLNSYLVTHSEHSAVPGMLPQVRVVGYTVEQE